MKRIITTLTIILFGFTAAPTFANNWQWQTDQIKADQQRWPKCCAVEHVHLLLRKMATDSRCRDTNTAPAPAPAKSVPGK